MTDSGANPMKQAQDSGELPKEAIEAVRRRQGFRIGSHSWEVIRPTVEGNLRAAAPAIRAQERERIREALVATLIALHNGTAPDRGERHQMAWRDGVAAAQFMVSDTLEDFDD